jgi:hypothetical protein
VFHHVGLFETKPKVHHRNVQKFLRAIQKFFFTLCTTPSIFTSNNVNCQVGPCCKWPDHHAVISSLLLLHGASHGGNNTISVFLSSNTTISLYSSQSRAEWHHQLLRLPPTEPIQNPTTTSTSPYLFSSTDGPTCQTLGRWTEWYTRKTTKI